MLKRWNFLKTGFYEGINIEPSKPRVTDKRPNSYTPLTDSEIHHRVAKWLYYMCGYRSTRIAGELHGVSK